MSFLFSRIFYCKCYPRWSVKHTRPSFDELGYLTPKRDDLNAGYWVVLFQGFEWVKPYKFGVSPLNIPKKKEKRKCTETLGELLRSDDKVYLLIVNMMEGLQVMQCDWDEQWNTPAAF